MQTRKKKKKRANERATLRASRNHLNALSWRGVMRTDLCVPVASQISPLVDSHGSFSTRPVTEEDSMQQPEDRRLFNKTGKNGEQEREIL